MFRKIFHTMEAGFGHFSTQWKRVFHTVENPIPPKGRGGRGSVLAGWGEPSSASCPAAFVRLGGDASHYLVSRFVFRFSPVGAPSLVGKMADYSRAEMARGKGSRKTHQGWKRVPVFRVAQDESQRAVLRKEIQSVPPVETSRSPA